MIFLLRINNHSNTSQFPWAQVEARIYSFSFLSMRHVIVARTINQSDESSAVLDVFDFLATWPENAQLVCRFQLPHLTDINSVQRLTIRSDSSPKPSSQPPTSNGRPFYTAPSSCLLTVSMDFMSETGNPYNFILFVHHSALLEYLQPSSGDVAVPWKDWGPKRTRMIHTRYNERTFVNYVHGTRYVRLDSMARYGPQHLRMMDFNPFALSRGVSHPMFL